MEENQLGLEIKTDPVDYPHMHIVENEKAEGTSKEINIFQLKVLIEFNSEKDYPDRIVLEQGWDKKLDVVSHIEEWKKYRFYLWYRANERTDKNWVDTAFWSISARRIEDLNWATSNWQSDLPF